MSLIRLSERKSYGAVSFSGITEAGPFYEQIWSNRKRQTLRKARRDGRPHVKPGYAFTMYWRVRTPIKKKPVHYIGTAMCTGYRSIKIVDYWNDEAFAKRDGFLTLEEFRDWFYPKWREAPWLDDVLEAYHGLQKYDLSTGIISNWSRRIGKSVIAEFLQLEYMLIEWAWPLLGVSSLYRGDKNKNSS